MLAAVKNDTLIITKNNIHLQYQIIANENCIDGYKKVKEYGIQVIKEESNKKEKEIGFIRNITPDISKIENMLNLFAKNTVTPCHLQDIVEDYLAR